MPQVSTSTPAVLSEIRRGQVQNEMLARREEQRERVLARVDRLVRSMEAVAQRLSSEEVSTSQRSVLVSRFNELQRRVNELDGVVGSEGRGDAVSKSATVHLELGVDSSGKTRDAAKTSQGRRQLQDGQTSERPAAATPAAGDSARGTLVDIQA